jgi:hypothetical protein
MLFYLVERPNNVSLIYMRIMSSNIPNWEATLQKIVTSKEGDLIGNVEATDESSVLVSSEGSRAHYRIPKHVVEGFDGHAVSLKVAKTELEQYKADRREGFGEVK